MAIGTSKNVSSQPNNSGLVANGVKGSGERTVLQKETVGSTSVYHSLMMINQQVIGPLNSSAVEGRNGRLSQLYHNGRGVTESRLKASTVIHNYGIKRSDGTTAAERFYGTAFPDLFGWLVKHMDEIPLPRKARQRVIRNPLKLQDAPA